MAFLCMVFQEMVYALNCRNLKDLTIKQGLLSNKAMNIGMIILILMQLIVFGTPVGQIFNIVTLNFIQVLVLIVISIVSFVAIDFLKLGIKKFVKD